MLSLERINKAREAGYDDDQIVESISKKDPDFGSKISKAREAGHTSQSILQSIEKRLSASENSNVKPLYIEENPSNVKRVDIENDANVKQLDIEKPREQNIFKAFQSGLQSSASGQLSQAINGKTESELMQDPTFWEKLAHSGGDIAGDLPYMLIGGVVGRTLGSAAGSAFGGVGAPIGGALGGSAGSLALPSFMKQALKEYNQHEGDLSFGEFLQQADRTASETLKSGAFGVILGTLQKAVPLLEKIPGVGSLFSSKPAQKAAQIATETAAAATIPPVTEGRLPTGEDFAQAAAIVLGFNLAHLPSKIREKIQQRGESSGLTPEQYAQAFRVGNIEQLAKVLEIEPAEAKSLLSERDATILQSTPKAKARNLSNRISVEHAREDISIRKPENIDKSTESIQQDLQSTSDLINDLPKGNKKNLAKEAYKRGYVNTPNQLDLFLDEYESTYQSIPGNTGLSKNRKFMNKYASKNLEKRQISENSEEPIVSVKPTPERNLQIGRQQKREAKFEGNKAKLKEAQKRIDLSKRKIKNQANQKTEEAKAQIEEPKVETDQKIETPKDKVKSFTTEKGSTYKVEGNRTTRNKKFRPEHGKSEQGLQPTSQQTFYVTPDDAKKLSIFQAQGTKQVMYKFPDGRVGVMFATGPYAGKVSSNSVINPKKDPALGLIPVEVWDDGKIVHFGNKIVSVESRKLPTKSIRMRPLELSFQKPKEAKTLEPIIETTGEGAEQRLEEPKSRMQSLKDKASNALEAVKNPTELQHQIYTKTFDALEPLNRLEIEIPTEERVTTKIKQAQSAASDINNILTQGIFDNVSNTFVSGSLKDVYSEAGEIWQRATKGLKDGEYSIKEMDIYRTSKEALKRQQRGLKSGIDTNLATKDVTRLKQKYGPVEQRLRQFQSKTLEHYGKDLLGDKVIDQWSQDSHASLYRVMDYGKDAIVKEGSLAPKQPFYKAKGSVRKIIPPSESDIQNLSMLVTNAKKNDSILQYKKLVEEGKLPGKIVKSKNREMPEKMMDDLGIDPESKELAETLYNQSRKDSFTPETGRLRGWENGKPFEIEVPSDVYETFSSMAPSDTGTLTRFFKSSMQLSAKGIVKEPIKFLSIFGRDAYSSLIYSKTGSNPLSIVKALTDIYKDSHSWNQFKSLGGEQYSARLMTRADRVGRINELLKTERPNAVMIPFHKLSEFLSKHSSNLAASVPFAEYQRAVKKFGDTPSGRLKALIEAKSISPSDPTKRGSSKLVRGAANWLMFLNPMLQEPAMIAKNMKRPMFWAKGGIGMTIPTLILKMYNDGNPDYEDMSPLLKASCWHFYTPVGHFAVPIPWLLGALFKAVPEMFYDFAKGTGGDAWKGLSSFIVSQLAGTFHPMAQAAVEQSTEKSLPSPLGLALMPFADIEKRAPPVVPRRLENLPPEQQYTSKTSPTAKWFAGLWGASPIKVERLLKTFTGGLGAKGLALVDEMVYRSGMAEDLRPEQGAKNYLIMGQFLSENTPSNTKYTSEFYDMLEQSKTEKQRGNENRYKSLHQDNMKISARLRKYRDIEESSMDPKQKREVLQALQKEINAMYKDSVLRNRQ